MKKNVKILGILSLVLSIGLLVSQCGKDDMYHEITGTVTIDGANAAGAIISVSDAPNSANVIATAVSDSTGKYSVGTTNGTFYLVANYEPSNNNNLKAAGTVVLSSMEVEVKVDGDDVSKDLDMIGYLSGGTGKVSLTNGWSYDNTHSTIEFEFPYDVENAIFTGHFSNTGFDVMEFDEAAPQNTQINAWVDLTSVETGSPSGVCGHGRDGITGCIAGTFKIDLDPADTVTVYCDDGEENTHFPNTAAEDYDLWGTGADKTSYKKQSAINGATGVSTFVVENVVAYGTGYKADAKFTFAGVTKTVDFYFDYLSGYEAENRQGQLTKYSSFYGWFKFDALGDFAISSGHVGDAMITVKVSAQFNAPVE